jgi:hypothetical protein
VVIEEESSPFAWGLDREELCSFSGQARGTTHVQARVVPSAKRGLCGRDPAFSASALTSKTADMPLDGMNLDRKLPQEVWSKDSRLIEGNPFLRDGHEFFLVELLSCDSEDLSVSTFGLLT